MYVPLPSIDMCRKLNAKRLLTFGIIVILTLVAVMATARPASANPGEPWWFLPAKWHFETGASSSRTMIICTDPVDSSIPSPSVINTVGAVSFDLDISAPDASGLAKITIPEASISIDQFYIKSVPSLITIHLWGELYATGGGNGTLATVDNALDVDVLTTVTGHGDGTSTVTTTIGDGTKDPAGSSLVSLPLELHIWSGQSATNPTSNGLVDMTTPLPIYVTTGFTKTRIVDPTPYPSGSVSMNGRQINGTGVPADSNTGVFTGVATGGGLDLHTSVILIGDLYSDYLFKEVMVATPSPSLPSEPITDVTALPTAVVQGDPVGINVTVHNGLAYSATVNITVSADSTVIGTQTGVTVAAGATKTLTFTWDTSSVTPGTYTIKAELSGKTVIASNAYTFHDAYLDSSVDVTSVIPEFPQSLFTPLLIIMTLAATILAKTVWSKKHKNIPTAPLK